MADKHIRFEKKGKTGWITIDRPENLNSLGTSTLLEIESALDEIDKDENILVGVITGSGEKAFCAGADLRELGKPNPISMMNYSKTCHRVFGKIENLGKVVICGLNGLAMGGGFELALSCTLRIMSEKAFLALPELALGAMPGAGGTQRLARLIGKSRALWYILTGERMDANSALNLGLVHKVIAPDQVPSECEKVANVICEKSPFSVRLALQAINVGGNVDLHSGLELETVLTMVCTASEDAKEGIEAMQNKRPPNFKGR